MKIKELLKMTIPEPGKGLTSAQIFGIEKRRALDLKKALDAIYLSEQAPIRKKLKALPKNPVERHKPQFQEVLDMVIKFTAPRKYLEIMAELEVQTLAEANFIVHSFTIEMFNRISTNQNLAVEINTKLLAIKPPLDGKDQK